MSDIPKSKTKVALIGAGGWGREHARVLSQHPDVEFCAIAGRTPEKTEARAEQYGVRAYTNIAQMLEVERPDLVSISLPNQSHFEPTLQVIQAGIPLFVEKPLVFDLDEANTLLQEAAQRDLFFAINFNHRYAKPIQKARGLVEAGELGDIVFCSWRFGGEGYSDHPHANLIETQCHAFDTVEYLCGPIKSVMAQMTSQTGKGFSTLVLALQFASGAVGSLVGSYDSSYAYASTHFMEINGTAGRILMEDTVRRFSFQRAGDETAQVWQAGYFNDRDREFHRTFDFHFDAVIQALRNGSKPPIHASAGLRALELAYAAIESFENGSRIKTL